MQMAQYTIRKVPASVDKLLRERARTEGKSLNEAAIEAAIEALQAGLGLSEVAVEFDDLDDLIGTWQHDPDTDQALADQDVVDLELSR